MTAIAELLSAVTSRYTALDCPAWPDPWPTGSPDDDSYSRVTDPDRYRILFRRTDSWLSELVALPGITVETVAEPGGAGQGRPPARVRRVVSDRPGAGALVLLEWDEPQPALTLALDHPDAMLETKPECGCDACDDGSEALLDAVDRVFIELLTSPVVVLHGPGRSWQAHWSHHDKRGTGHPDEPPTFGALMRLCERIAAGADVAVPAGTKVWVSQPWLGAGGGGPQGAAAQT